MSIDQEAFGTALAELDKRTADSVIRGTVISPRRELEILIEAYEAAKAQPAPAATGEVACPKCGGQGWTEGMRARCCGNVTSSGDCRADCAVPEQTQDQCGDCGGSGFASLPNPTGLVEQMRDVLGWYAVAERYQTTASMENSAWVDGGKRAREALAEADAWLAKR